MNNPIEIDELKARIAALETRNKRVEMGKAWEGSIVRRATIMAVTYIIVVAFLFIIGNSEPFIDALVPPTGFLLSTLVVSDLKKHWVKGRH